MGWTHAGAWTGERGPLGAAVMTMVLVLTMGCAGGEKPVSEQDMERASEVLTPYKRQLKGTLMAALEEGPEVAIGVCQGEAPEIAAAVAPPGVTLGRTSHRLRNPDNAPEPWMAPLLSAYQDDPDERAPRAVDLGDGTFGYVEPIVMAPPCETCHGSGRAHEKRKLTVAIPPGVDEGMKIRLAGEGEGGVRGGPPGDLFIQAKLLSDPVYSLENYDLHMNHELKLSEAVLGTRISVPTLEGKELSLKIPPGTKPGTKMRMSGHGLPHMKGNKKGDLYVKIQIKLPKKLTKEQRNLIEKLAEAGL